ncbi:hypothetical protein B0H12DRAFT_1117627 [Mycena haematopus]|nr:hypothetical protein B0H12DRAFT_1117627 [Mycena haematopus]
MYVSLSKPRKSGASSPRLFRQPEPIQKSSNSFALHILKHILNKSTVLGLITYRHAQPCHWAAAAFPQHACEARWTPKVHVHTLDINAPP